MNLEVLPADSDLIEAVAERVCAKAGSSQDLSSLLVVFPGKRPGHFLRRALARRIGKAFEPPRILPLGDLVDECFDRWHAGGLPLAQAIDAVAVLHEIQLEPDQRLGGQAFLSLDAFLPLGFRIFDAIEEMLVEKVQARRVGEIHALIEGGIPRRSRDRLATLQRFYERFYPLLAERGLSTRSSRYREVGDRLTAADFDDTRLVVMAGFFELREAEAAMARTIARLPQGLLLYRDGPGLRRELERLGATGFHPPPPDGHTRSRPWPAVSADRTGPGDRPAVSFYKSPDTHGQAFALAGLLESPSSDTVVVLPSSESLFPLERHCLSRLEPDGYNISLGYPLSRTALYGFLASLMDLVSSRDGDRFYVPDYLALLLHPYTKGVRFGSSAEATRVLLHEVEERLAASRTRTFVTLEEIEGDVELFQRASGKLAADGGPTAEELAAHLRSIHGATIRACLSFATVAEFAQRLIELVEWVHDRGTARLHPHFSSFSEQLVASLETVRRSLLAPRSFESTAGYFSLLRRYLATCRVPFEGTPLHGLQVLGMMETRCLRFERVFILDANEGSLPAIGGDDSLLALPARQALGLPAPHDRERAARYRFEELAAGARELHLLYVDDGEAEPSRFVERLLWEEEKRDGMIDRADRVRSISYRVSLQQRAPEPVPRSEEVAAWLPTISLSPSALDAWLACPLRFYYSRVLGLRERDEASGEIEPADIGSFVHEVLKGFLAPHVGKLLEASKLDPAAMGGAVDRLFPQHFGDAGSGALRLLHRQIRRHLCDFAGEWLRPLASRGRVVVRAVERTHDMRWEEWLLTGKVDLELEIDGEPWVLDYKTSSNPAFYAPSMEKLNPDDRSSWLPALKSAQLPVYLLLQALEAQEPPTAARGMFLLLGRSRLDEGIQVPLFEDAEHAALYWPRVEQVLRLLIAEVLDPSRPFAPTEDRPTQCPRCPYTALCGTGWLAGTE